MVEGVIEEIRRKCDLVELINTYLSLKKVGKRWVALCPFHEEKTPSFTVNPEKQFFYCFGCGEGGDIFSFLMKIENLSFAEAVKLLADSANIEIKEVRKFSNLYEINEEATVFYTETLFSREGRDALSYLAERGIKEDTIRGFRLGYAPCGWDRLKGHMRRKFSERELIEAGLLRKGERGSYDWIQKRLIFPIADRYGRIAGFGARALDGSVPKYINTKETPVYNKSKILYGLDKAISAIKEKRSVILVEGYTDVIMAHQYGFCNVVATCGTSLTKGHIRQIQQAEEVIISFDPDKAGKTATERGIDLLMEENFGLSVLLLTDGLDPANLLQKKGGEAFEKALAEKKDFLDFYLDVAEKKDKRDALNYLVPIIEKISNPLKRKSFVHNIAERLSVDEEIILSHISKTGPPFSEHLSKRERGLLSAERLLIGMMIEDEEIAVWAIKEIDGSMLKEKAVNEIFCCIKEKLYKERKENLVNLVSEEAKRLLASLSMEELGRDERYRVAEDCINKIKQESLKEKCKAIQKEIRERANKGEDISSLLLSYQQAEEDIHRLRKGGR